ncbi:MAG: hypothetical protein AAGC95_16100 [Pseudomonadota bacterium]
MTAQDIVFAPLVPWAAVWGFCFLAAAATGLGLFRRAKGAMWRGLAFAALIGLIANPSLRVADRTPLDDIVVVVTDRSESQGLKDRPAATDAALDALEAELSALDGVETRTAEAGATADGTQLMGALDRALADTPPARLSAVVLITDGLAADAVEAAEAAAEAVGAPVHVLLTGEEADKDRKLTVISAPRYGIVGEQVEIAFRVDEYGPNPSREAQVAIRLDGEVAAARSFRIGEEVRIGLTLEHAGPNVLEIATTPIAGELTQRNNVSALPIAGVRDRLRVLLVSGEPHAGERTWRNLLKSDPAVDLVHFTILRPLEKSDATPIDEMALIPFPVQELFQEKLTEFDLVIFDRYKLRRVLSFIYFDNILQYVRNGGAMLIAAGPEFATQLSLANTALSYALPAVPTGEVLSEGFRPQITEDGARHPVTGDLTGAGEDDWGRWFRMVTARQITGDALMAGPENRPLLVLDRQGDGRVAQLMSDQAWLWARGVEGGGPHAELLRRLAHWLMREPDLEEEDLKAEARGETLFIERRTMADEAAPVSVATPSGETFEVTLEEVEPGLFAGTAPAEEIGLYRLSDDALYAVAASGAVNLVEYSDVIATEDRLAPLVTETGGGVFRIQNGAGAKIPALRQVREGRARASDRWMGLVRRDQYDVRAVEDRTLLPPYAWLALVLGLLAIAWLRESR